MITVFRNTQGVLPKVGPQVPLACQILSIQPGLLMGVKCMGMGVPLWESLGFLSAVDRQTNRSVESASRTRVSGRSSGRWLSGSLCAKLVRLCKSKRTRIMTNQHGGTGSGTYWHADCAHIMQGVHSQIQKPFCSSKLAQQRNAPALLKDILSDVAKIMMRGISMLLPFFAVCGCFSLPMLDKNINVLNHCSFLFTSRDKFGAFRHSKYSSKLAQMFPRATWS